ncbi:MAG: DUF4350 domain-containing protein [Armatimonadetes bacterium]|nr:DUF4350 domain-containing protein [Armatimonadota bacterium]
MRKRRLDPTRLLVGFLIFAALMVALLANSEQKSQTLPRAQWNDATPLGGKGLRLLLGKLGYTLRKQIEPLQKMPSDAKIWLILDPETRFTKKEATILLDWVKKGGTVVFSVRPTDYYGTFNSLPQSEGIESLRRALGVERAQSTLPKPGEFLPELEPLSLDAVSIYRTGVKGASGSSRTFGITRPHLEIAGPPSGSLARLDIGKGRVFVAPDALLFTNYALAKPDNAVLVSNLLRAHAPSGAVYFDERSHGENAASSAPDTLISHLKRPPVSYAIGQLLLAGLLFWAFAGRRLGAPVGLPEGGPVTRASQFAGAMGALFLKTNRPQAAAAIIGARFRRRLAHRLGLSPAENDAILARRAQEIAGIPFEVTDRLLLQSRAPAQTLSDALRDAQEMELVLRKLEGR